MVAAGYPSDTLAAGACMQALARLMPSRVAIEVSGAGGCLASGDHRPGGRRQRPRWRLRDSPLRPRCRLRDSHRFGLWFRLRDSPRYLLGGRQRGGSGTRDQAARSDAAASRCLRRSGPDVRPRRSSDLLGRRRASSRSPTLAAGCSGTLSKRQCSSRSHRHGCWFRLHGCRHWAPRVYALRHQLQAPRRLCKPSPIRAGPVNSTCTTSPHTGHPGPTAHPVLRPRGPQDRARLLLVQVGGRPSP